MQSHWDGPQFSIAVVRYSLSQETPTFPGYPIYIGLGRVVYAFISDPYLAILSVSVIASGVSAVLFYVVGKQLFGKRAGLIACLLYFSGPTFFYFGLTPYPYGLLPIVSLIFGGLTYFTLRHKENGFLYGVVVGILLGFRPQELLSLLPLYLFGVYHLSPKERLVSLVGGIIGIAIWLVPFLALVGGIDAYIVAARSFALGDPIAPLSLIRSFTYFQRVIKGFYLTFTLGVFIFIYFIIRAFISGERKYKIIFFDFSLKQKLFMFWIIPSLMINLVVRSDHAGYQMTYLTAFVLILANKLTTEFSEKRKYLYLAVAVICCFNLWWFFRDRDPMMSKPYVPTSFHYSEIRKNDVRLSAQLAYLKAHYDPSNTYVFTDSQLWRPLMYYLKEYHVIDLEGFYTSELQYKWEQRDAYEWDFQKKKVSRLRFHLPVGIDYLVFVGNGKDTFIRGAKDIGLAGNAHLAVVLVEQRKILRYGYHQIYYEGKE